MLDNQAKQSIILQRRPEEDWKVLDSSPITNLEIAMLKLQNSIPQLFTSIIRLYYHMVFPGGSDGKESACITGDPGSIPGSGRPPGEGND